MEQWLESVYSDGSDYFVSDPQPVLFETVKIQIRMCEEAPVDHVFLRTVPNGAEQLIEAEIERVEHGLVYYAAEMKMTENRMQYQFYLVCKDVIYYYNQKEITTFIPDQTYDFVLLADYRQPSWVKNAVFYQIFPDRFCNGDPSISVKDGEYTLNEHPTIQMKNWEERPLPYEKGFCLDFFGGDLAGVKKKIPYLKELGVTAIYLNPIFEAPTMHKYDCIDYFHVDPHLGGDEALAELSEALHQNGMRLILDISINHTGTAHKWFNRDHLFFPATEGAYNNPQSKERGYYFISEDNQYLGWFDNPDLPTLNYTSRELRDVIYQAQDSVLKKWLRPPYSIDGWRFDVADVFARNNEVQLAHEVWPEIRKSIREVNPDGYILAEDWGDCAQYLQGKEWDSAMNYYGCGRVIRQFLGEPDLFLGRNEILRKVPYKMTAQDVKARVMEHLSKLPFAIWQNQFNLFDSHDVPRLHNDPAVDQGEYRGAVILLFTMIGTASIYYGDEAGADGWITDNDGCRCTMPWNRPFQETDTYKLYQTLANLKKNSRALTEGGMKFIYAECGIVAIARFYGEEVYVSMLSTESEKRQIHLPLFAVGAVEPEKTEDLFGTVLNYEREEKGIVRMEVEAHQAYLFRCRIK